jgi:adenosine deaminase
VRILEDDVVVSLAKERGTVFEVCVTSNFQSGVVKSVETHPLQKMMEAGLKVTINTDDPSISRITLANEYQIVCDKLNVELDALKKSVILAAQSAFLDDKDKEKLITLLKKELKI